MRTRRYLALLLVLLMSTVAGSAQDSATPDSSNGPAPGAGATSTSSGSDSLQPDFIRFSPSPGTYPETVHLSVEDTRGSGTPRLWYRFTEDDDETFLPVEGGIVLSEVPGGAYSYTVEIARAAGGAGDMEILARAAYRVDPRIPSPPSPDPVPGVYRDAVELRLAGVEGTEVTYAFARDSGPLRTYTGPITLAAGAGERAEYNVLAYASTEAGYRSEVFRGRYVIDATQESSSAPSVRMVSPVSGSFNNRQLLVVESTGVSDIRFTTDGSDPREDGRAYAAPVLLERTGSYTVRVAGTTADGRVFEDAAEVSVSDRDLIDLSQGVITEDRRISAPGVTAYFTTDDRPATSGSTRFAGPISVSPSAGVRRLLVVRVRVPQGEAAPAGEYRYTYVLEGRTAAQPEAIVHHSPESAGTLYVSLLSSPGAAIRYTTDGSPPGQGSLYTGPAEIELPAGRDAGTLTLRAVSVYSGSVESPELSREISFDTRAPEAPRVSLSGSMHTSSATIEVTPPAEAAVVYAVGDAAGSSPRPTRWDPQVRGATVRIPAPVGSDRTVTVAFASVDAAGNRSDQVETLELRLDGKAPTPPDVSLDGRRLVIDGENVQYYLRPDEEGDVSRSTYTFAPYGGAVFLAAPVRGRTVYTVRAFSQDDLGNRSSVVSRRVVSDAREAQLPAQLGVEDGAVYGSAVTLRNLSTEPDLELRYALSYSDQADAEIEEPEAPSTERTVGDGVTMDAPEGVERRYLLVVQPVLTSSDRTGSVARFQFTVDRKRPEPPEVTGIENGRTYGSAVSFAVQPAHEGDRVEYRLVRQGGGDPADDAEEAAAESAPAASGEPWLPLEDGEATRRVDVAVGEDRRFTLTARSIDPAGNVTETTAPVKFRIDRERPEAPRISVDGAQRTADGRYLATGAVTVTIGAEGAETYYRISRAGAGPPEQGAVSPADQVYEAPFDVQPSDAAGEGEPASEGVPGGKRTHVSIQAMTRDAAGNESVASLPVTVTIDTERPDPPEVVDVTTDDSGRGGTVIWRHQDDAVVRYRVVAGNRTGEERTTQRIGKWQLPEGASTGELEYYAEDRAGNRSNAGSVAVRGFSAAPTPELAGIEADAVYGATVVLENRTTGGTVRYEVSTDGSEPPAVTRFSPELPAQTPFDVAPGETVSYRVAARTFAEDARPSPVVSLGFIVDRGAPSAPEIVGFRDGDFLTEDVEVRFKSSAERVFYSVVETPEERTAEPEFARFREAFTLEAKPGGVVHYRVSAYSVDSAGNRSDETETWDVFLGEQIVYVAPDGSQDGAGTIDDPVSDLAAAVERARRDEKRTIFIAEGSYEVTLPLVLRQSLTVQGGFDAQTWRRTEESRSSLTLTAEAFSEAGGAVVVEQGKLTVGRFDIVVENSRSGGADRGSVPADRFAVMARDSALFVQNVSLSLHNAGAVHQSGGDVTLKRVDIVDERGGTGTLLSVEGGRTVLDDVTVRGSPRGRDSALLSARDAQLFIQDGGVEAGGGDRSLGIRAESSRLAIGSSEVHAGTGERSARGVYATGGSLRIIDSRFSTSERSRIATAVTAADARTTIEGSTFTLRGSGGVAGVAVQGGSLTLGRSTFNAQGVSSGFIHLVAVRSATSDLVANAFVARDAGEVIVARVTSSDVRFVNNTAVTEKIRGAAFGINAGGTGSVLVQNSIFSHDGSGSGRAVFAADRGSTFTLRTNSFEGWESLYERSVGGFSRARSSRSATLSSLNGAGGLEGVTATGNISGSAPAELDTTGRVPRLDADAVEINAGSLPPEDLPYRNVDLEGQPRPAPAASERSEDGDTPAGEAAETGTYDIGADEFYR